MMIRIHQPSSIDSLGNVREFPKRAVTIDGATVAWVSQDPGGLMYPLVVLSEEEKASIIDYVTFIDGVPPAFQQLHKPKEMSHGY